MSEFVPSVDAVRFGYSFLDGSDSEREYHRAAAFDRWLAGERAAVLRAVYDGILDRVEPWPDGAETAFINAGLRLALDEVAAQIAGEAQ